MITRRRFLKQSALAPAAAAVASTAHAEQATPSALPASIAALTSMRDQAVPVSVDERRARLERARRLMTEQKLDAVVLTGGTSLTYFTGARWGNSERLMALVLPVRGEPFCVIPAFEADRVREQLAVGPLQTVDLRLWHEDEDPFVRVAQALKDRGIVAGRMGLEETVKFVFSDGLEAAAPGLGVTSATPVIAGCRMIKDAHEVALMRLACQATLRCYRGVFESLRPGMTESEVEALVHAGYARLGFRGSVSVQVGEFTALPHGSTTPQSIREGTIVMVDDGCVVEGYQSDITRTFVLGKATDRMNPGPPSPRIFLPGAPANQAGLEILRKGSECSWN